MFALSSGLMLDLVLICPVLILLVQTLEVCEPEMEKEAETEVRVEVEEDVTDFSVAETGNEFTKEPAAGDLSKPVSAETGTEVVTETPEPEPRTESVSSAQEGDGNVEADVSAKEDEAAVCAEPLSAGVKYALLLKCFQFIVIPVSFIRYSYMFFKISLIEFNQK